jgi:predicted dehydrogenase
MASSKNQITRRGFLKRSAGLGLAAVAGPLIVPARVFGANDRIGVGYIGFGRRARQLTNIPQDAQAVACSDADQRQMDAFTSSRIGKDAKQYLDYRELLQDPNVDAIITATPDHWHALVSVHACEAGKDVYVEKPMTLTIREGRLMVEAARKHGRIVQVGSQQRSMKECRIGCELIRNGRIGNIHTVHTDNYPSPWECDLPEEALPEGLDWDRWMGPTEPHPYHIDLYLPRANNRKDALGRQLGWISYRPWSGGEMTGWGAHGLDIIQWALGMDESGPVEAWPELDGWKGPEKWPEGRSLTCPVTMRYANGTLVKLDAKGPGGGGLFEGEEGTILVDRGKYTVTPKELGNAPLGDDAVRLYESNDHMQNWFDCIRSRQLSAADVETGHRSTTMCHLGNIARWLGRKVTWDPETETFPGDDEANALMERPMREPYTF